MSRVPFGRPNSLAEIVQQLHEPHAARGGIHALDIVAGPRTDVSVDVDDEIAAARARLGFASFLALASAASASPTSKNFMPVTSFAAIIAAEKPSDDLRKLRRDMPAFAA